MSNDVTEVKQEQAAELAVAEPTHGGPFYTPRVDIRESADELTLVADMPGVEADGVDINLENGELTLHGRVNPRHAGIGSLYSEYGIGDFHRAFRLSSEIDSARITANVKNGVLTVHLPKSDAAKPRKIEVHAG
jgi:HSP20 family molecular chaperone IbpA